MTWRQRMNSTRTRGGWSTTPCRSVREKTCVPAKTLLLPPLNSECKNPSLFLFKRCVSLHNTLDSEMISPWSKRFLQFHADYQAGPAKPIFRLLSFLSCSHVFRSSLVMCCNTVIAYTLTWMVSERIREIEVSQLGKCVLSYPVIQFKGQPL